MGWLTKMLSPEDPASPPWPASWLGGERNNDAGVSLSELNSRSAAGVLACVRVISEAAAAYPKEIYQEQANGKRLATEHPLYSIIHDAPNPYMTNFIFWVGVISQTCIWGNGYAEIQRDGANRARALWPIDAGKTRPFLANGRLVYKTTVGVEAGYEREILPSNIIHIPFLSLNGLEGQSPIQIKRQSLGLSMAAERFGAMLFGKGARPSGLLEVASGMGLKPEQRSNMKQSFQEGMSGANAMGVALLEPGVTFKPLTINPNDAQFLETRKYQLEDIARDYRVPAHMLGILERATHSNAEQLGYDFSTYTMLAWVLMIEQELNRKLFASSQFYVKLNMDVFLRGDFETRMAGYQAMRNVGVLTTNDINRMEDWPQVSDKDGGNVRTIPLNMTSLKSLKLLEDQPPEQVKPPLAPETPVEQPAKAELRHRFAFGFTRLFADAVGRTNNKDKKDETFVSRVWLPPLTALAESIASLDGARALPEETHAFLADYVGAIAQRCTAWQKGDANQTAEAEFNRAYIALSERV